MPTPDEDRVLLLFDGVCGLCHRTVQFLLERDRHDRIRFAALQSDLARRILARHGRNADDLDSVCLVRQLERADESLLFRSQAVVAAVSELGGSWSAFKLFQVVPVALLDVGYRLVASTRYRLFGKLEACPIPTPAQRAKFVA